MENEVKNIMSVPVSGEKLLRDIDVFCDKNKINRSDFGVRVLNDRGFYTKLKNGRSPTLERVEKIYEYIVKFNQLDLFS